jgi:metallopeptidase MepB
MSSAAVFAADIFANTFAESPRSHKAWEKYRRGILEYGGSRDEIKMLEEFLGHRYSSEYFLRSLQIPML